MGFRTLSPLSRTFTRAILFNNERSYCLRPFSSDSSHDAIRIKGGGAKTLSKEEMAERQRTLMARNLPKRRPVEGVKNVVLVASGKGGVGKSTVAVNLAVGMKKSYPDKTISLLDADVFGPSLPRMMGLEGEPELTPDGKLMIPLQNYGVKCMSLGFLVSQDAPVVWRGLMVMSALEKLIRGVNWAPSDLLLVDMPPGTGDTQLTFAQTVQVTGAVIVTTPQKVALQDATKGVEMFRKTGIPILGAVINMASYSCPGCGTETPILPENVEEFERAQGIPVLGRLPLEFGVGVACDEGYPIVLQGEGKGGGGGEGCKQIVEKLYDKLF